MLVSGARPQVASSFSLLEYLLSGSQPTCRKSHRPGRPCCEEPQASPMSGPNTEKEASAAPVLTAFRPREEGSDGASLSHRMTATT